MNIKQAKTRFTEITGWEAKAEVVYYLATVFPWLQRAIAYAIDNSDIWRISARHTIFWVLIVEYLETYICLKEEG